MPKNSFLKAIFSGPKFSLAPIEENNRGSVKLGQVIPVWSTILNPREGVELDMSHLVRMMPAKAPVMEGYKVTFDAFAVPFSCLGYAERKERDIDDFFNIKENAGEIANPFCFPMRRLQAMLGDRPNLNGYDRQGLNRAFALGSLGDYINFPSLKNVRDHVRKWLDVNPFAFGAGINQYVNSDSSDPFDSLGLSVASFVASAYFNDPNIDDIYAGLTIDLTGRGHGLGYALLGIPFSTSDNPVLISSNGDYVQGDGSRFYTQVADESGFGYEYFMTAYSLLGYILRNYPVVASYYGFEVGSNFEADANKMANHIAFMLDTGAPLTLDYLQVLYDNYKIDAQSIYNEYFEYIMSLVLYNPDLKDSGNNLLYYLPEAADEEMPVTFLPCLKFDDQPDLSYLAAYWKIISDWYINTNIDGDPEAFFLEHCHILTDSELSSRPTRYLDVKPFERRWSNDIFTSSVPMAQVQNIRIPADGTIPDLREANAYQKLVDIFRNTGSRLRDVVYGVFGITPSAVRSEMSEPIGSLSSWVGFQSVLQTSATTPDSPQAAYAGIGTDSSNGYKRILKYVNNGEPTPVIIMVLMSITQRASYMQGFDRKFFRKSIYDFAIPELAMIGEQEVTNKEIYFDKDSYNGVFGFNRRYYDWFYSGSQVHGELRDSMDYWHGARIFDDQPVLNSEFIGIDSDADHLQRVFANTSEAAMPIVYNIAFDGYKTVALPRYIQYEL